MKPKVDLGERVIQFQTKYNLPKSGGEKASTKRIFSEILESPTLVESLLRSNTFFHAKLGFYEKIYMPLLSKSAEHKVIYTAKQFPRTSEYKRMIVIPRTASSDELNSLIAKALNYDIPIWAIAPFSLISPSILISFRNFFITFHKKEELEGVLSLFDFSLTSRSIPRWVEEKLQHWQNLESVAVLITNHPSFLPEKDNIALFELQL